MTKFRRKSSSAINLGMSRDSRIAEDPGKCFSETGSTRKCEIRPLFSDCDPNPRPNNGNCSRVELFDGISANIKSGTGETGKSPEFDFIFGGT